MRDRAPLWRVYVGADASGSGGFGLPRVVAVEAREPHQQPRCVRACLASGVVAELPRRTAQCGHLSTAGRAGITRRVLHSCYSLSSSLPRGPLSLPPPPSCMQLCLLHLHHPTTGSPHPWRPARSCSRCTRSSQTRACSLRGPGLDILSAGLCPPCTAHSPMSRRCTDWGSPRVSLMARAATHCGSLAGRQCVCGVRVQRLGGVCRRPGTRGVLDGHDSDGVGARGRGGEGAGV